MWCSGIPHIYDQLEQGSLSDGYRSFEHARMSRQPYVALLLATRCLYVKLMQHSGIPEIYCQIGGTFPWVDVHSAMCETYVV